MTIHDLCTRCQVTKKAVAYAVRQGLLTPAVRENGYRDFSEEDACTMAKIATLRVLGLSTEDIRAALTSPDWTALCRARAVSLAAMQEKQRIFEALAADGNWLSAREKVARLEQSMPVIERLRMAFPGPFGTFLAAHFVPYLNEPVRTEAQRSAWQEIVSWLDSAAFTVPDDLAEVYADMALSPVDAHACDANLEAALRDPAAYLQAHGEDIARSQAIRDTLAYRRSPAARLEQHLKDFLARSGYSTVFIPAMRRLSPLYDAHQRRLEAANAAFAAVISEKTKETP